MTAHGPIRGQRTANTPAAGLGVAAGPEFMTNPNRACAHAAVDAEMFFSARDIDQNLARRICRGCPVQLACLTWALQRGETHGVWGSVLMSSTEEVRKARELIPCQPAPAANVAPVLPTRAEKKAALEAAVRAQWEKNQPDSVIATRVGVAIGTVVNIRKRLQLPALYGAHGRRLPQQVNA
jgi:hypothetical protein